jgi:hypothetical protein
MTNSRPDYLVWLQGERTSLKRLINIARQVDDLRDWDLDALWAARFTELIAFIESGQLKGHLHRRSRWSSVCLRDLWEFLSRHPYPTWDWCRDFCRRWSEVSGIPLPGSNASSSAARSGCKQWLVQLMGGGKPKTKSKKEYLADAQRQFKGLSQRSFNTEWAAAIHETKASWDTAGRLKSKS